MNTNSIIVSIIIPTKNAGPGFYKTLKAWKNQICECDLEIVIIDSGSTDDTISIARKFNAKIITIPHKEFQHGSTRNLGIKYSKGDFLIYTVQDAVPADYYIIQRFLSNFKDYPELKAINGRQIPNPKEFTNPLEWKKCFDKLNVYKFNPEEFIKLSPEEQYQISFWDNVLAIYKRESLAELPFPSVNFGEDIIWGYFALKKGWTLARNYSCCVYHYHHYNCKRNFNRTFAAFVQTYVFWNYVRKYPSPVKTFASVTYKMLFKQKSNKKFYWLIYNYKFWLCKYLAYFYFRVNLLFQKKKLLKSIYSNKTNF